MATATQTKSAHLEEELDKKMAQIQDKHLEEESRAIAQQSGLQYVDLRLFPIDNTALFLVEESEARPAHLAVITKNGTLVTVAVQDPHGTALQPILTALAHQGLKVQLVIASAHGLAVAWTRYKLKKEERDNIHGIMTINQAEIENLQTQIQDIKDLKGRITSLPITQVLNTLIAGALKIGASDIHFEPEEHAIRLRYRLDGVLTDVVNFSPALAARTVTRTSAPAAFSVSPSKACSGCPHANIT